MTAFTAYFQDFLNLFFPSLCAGCGTHLLANEEVICTSCIYHLPLTNFHDDPNNQLAKQLMGRFQFIQASSYVYFRKKGRVQRIMHELKYRNRPETGFKMGQLYARVLTRSVCWNMPDLLIPVPLHPAKLKQRGYNQSEYIAKGMATVLLLPVVTGNLIRIANTETQTKKSRFERYENLKHAFHCHNKYAFEGKHVLLVDDVVTTGATLEACSQTLLAIPGVRISIATLAFAE